MKKSIWWIFGLIFSNIGLFNAQIVQPVIFHTQAEKINDKTYDLVITADIEPGWHLYSQFNDPNGSNPVVLQWQKAGEDYELIGKTKEFGTEKAYNDIFEVTETFWSGKAKMVQRVKLKKAIQNIDVYLEGQACKEACIMIKENLRFDLSEATKSARINEKSNQTKQPGNIVASPDKKKLSKPDDLQNKSVDTGKNEKNNQTGQFQENNSGKQIKANDQTNKTENASNPASQAEIHKNNTNPKTLESVQIEEAGKKSLWWIFFMSFLGGLLALLMPCIYPMIPLTISFFTKQHEKTESGKFNALLYGFFIVGIFVLLSLPFHFLNGIDPNIFNKISTNVWLNLIFFIIFFIFGLSFLGVSKLDPQRLIPSKWISKSDEYSNKTSGAIAIFFMALTLILVSFSCTGPILGALLGSVLTSGAWALTVGMLGFGLGLALPFTLLAFFPALLNAMPQSGGWLNTLKVSFGFIEIALAFKFLSNADLVLQLHLLEREVFLSVWIAIFFGLSLYLLGLFKTPYDDNNDRIGVTRLMFALLSLAFTFYMLPGLWGAPLKWISAFPPYQKYAESPHGVGYSAKTEAAHHATNPLPEGAEWLHGGLIVFNDYDLGMAYARKINKPVMLDFTGFACVNCRKMENNVWTDPRVHQLMKNELIIISLYVDDKRTLPENEQYISKYSGKKITLAGDKWAELEIYEYKSNSQPYYVLLSPDGKVLNQPVAYLDDPEAYARWLENGIEKFKKHQ